MPKEIAKKRREDFDRRRFISVAAERSYTSVFLFKALIPERGFFNPGGRTEKVINDRNWGLLTKSPSSAVAPLVREFYANAGEEKNHSVYVRGKWIQYDSSTINNLYGLDEILNDDYSLFVTSTVDYNRIILYLCGSNERISWRVKDGIVINFPASGLTSESKAWHYFISARLLPSGNVSEVTRDRAVLNYCIQTGLTINIGKIISRSIKNILKAPSSVGLGHPSLIHELCVTQGVEILPSEEFTSPKSAITKQKISFYSSKSSLEEAEGSDRRRSSKKSLSITERVGRLEEQFEEFGETIDRVERNQLKHYEYVSEFNSTMTQMFENCSLNIGPRRVSFPEPPNYQQDDEEEQNEEEEENEEEED